MAKSSGRKRAKSDNQRIIEWYEAALKQYKGMIGEYTIHNTLVTEELVRNTEKRIEELKEKEKRWNDTVRKLLRQD